MARLSLAGMLPTEGPWVRIIRYFAIAMAFVGLAMVCNEIWENATCPALTLPSGDMVRASYCAKVHLSTMIWGLVMLSLGLLIIQKGDVSASLEEGAKVGTVVRAWWPQFGRRDYDKPPVVVEQPVVVEKKDDEPDKPTIPGT